MIHIRLSDDMRREVKLLCVYEDKTIQNYVIDLVQKDLEKRQKKGGIKRK